MNTEFIFSIFSGQWRVKITDYILRILDEENSASSGAWNMDVQYMSNASQ